MRALLLCAVLVVCASGVLGARRRFLGPQRRPAQRRPFGWREAPPQERQDFSPERRQFRPPAAPLDQLRLAPPAPFQTYQEPREPYQEPRETYQEPRESYQEPREPYQKPVRRVAEEPAPQDWSPAQERQDAAQEQQKAAQEQQYAAQEQQEATQEREEAVAPVAVAETAEPAAAETAPVYEPQPQVAAADEVQEQYSLKIPEKTDKNRLEFQVHGLQGPHSYKFGYDTGTGYNRQFRFEERDGDGNTKGRYGFYDQKGKLQVVNYSATHKGGFAAAGDFGAFPVKAP